MYLYRISIHIYSTYHIYYMQNYMDFGPHRSHQVALNGGKSPLEQMGLWCSRNPWVFHEDFMINIDMVGTNKSWDSSISLQFLSRWLATFEFIGGSLQLWLWFGSSLEVLSCMHQWCTTTWWFTSHVLIDLKHVNCSSMLMSCTILCCFVAHDQSLLQVSEIFSLDIKDSEVCIRSNVIIQLNDATWT